MNCEDYICDDEVCDKICDNCERMKERSCINCAINEECDGGDSYHERY